MQTECRIAIERNALLIFNIWVHVCVMCEIIWTLGMIELGNNQNSMQISIIS